jgi:hypothetical protein
LIYEIKFVIIKQMIKYRIKINNGQIVKTVSPLDNLNKGSSVEYKRHLSNWKDTRQPVVYKQVK